MKDALRVTQRIPPALQWLFDRGRLSEEMRIALVMPIYGRLASLFVGHLAGIIINLITVFRLQAGWPSVTLAAAGLALLARLALLIVARRMRRAGGDAALLQLTPWYVGVGLVWSLTSGVFVSLCFTADDHGLHVLAMALALGTCGGIASRNAGIPSFALLQLITWLLPVTLVGLWQGHDLRVLSVMTTLYLIALSSVVRQNYTNLVSLMTAERSKSALAARFDAAISNMTQGLLLVDCAGLILVVNQRFRELLPLGEDWLQPGRGLADLAVHCNTLGFDGAWLHLQDHPGEELLDLPDGRSLSINHEPLSGGGQVMTFADITGRRVAERALAEREAELQAIFSNAAAGVAEMDAASGRFIRVNRVFCRMVGRTEVGLLTGLTLIDVTDPGDHEPVRQYLCDIISLHTVFEGEQRFIRPDQSVLWARVSAAGSQYRDSGLPSRIVCVVHDITERKAAEAALQESEEMLRLSMQVGRIGCYQRDYVRGEIHCGAEARLIHGLPLGGGPVPTAVWLATVVPEDRDRLVKEIRAVHERQETFLGSHFRCRLPMDGAIRHIETRARIEYDGQGRPLRSVGVAIDVTERQQAQAQIAHLAHHDPLTNLPNRSLFRSRLDEALMRAREGEIFALCYLDLDHFKEVNDSLGHPAGDALLQAVSDRLCREVRVGDTVARLGGDEFAVIQIGRPQPEGAVALGQRLIERLAMPFDLSGHQVCIGASIGVAIVPEDGVDADALLKKADLALYHAKQAGRNRLRLFAVEMDQQMSAQRALERDLRAALEYGGFELFYQPLVEVETSLICGFEALIRWRHPERGLIRPDEFVPVAEATGLIVPMGEWVLRDACAQAVTWTTALSVAVNLSVLSFASRDLVETVAQVLRETGLAPGRLELEITETVMLQDTETTLTTLYQLKDLGVRIVLDDFGAGFSSLRYMQKFPFDKVKIDRSLIAELGQGHRSDTIVRAVIDLCAALGMDTVAEGVETAEQLAALAAQGCKAAQGYYFSVPRPAQELCSLMQPAQAA